MTERKKVEDYLRDVSDSYQPQYSDDPMENECATCTMSEESHKRFPKNTCDEFKSLKMESKDGDTKKGW